MLRKDGGVYCADKSAWGDYRLVRDIAFDVSRETILELASLPPAMPDPQRVRVMVAPAPLMFGMSRMFEMEGERTRASLHVVSTEQEAWAILGVSEPEFGPYRQ